MSDNPFDQFDSEAPQAKLPPVSGHGGRWQDAPLAGWQDAPVADDKGPWNDYAPAATTNPYAQYATTANQRGSLPVITDDGSNWATQPAQRPQANPYDQFAPPQLGNRAKLTPIDYDPFAQSGSPSKGQPTGARRRFLFFPFLSMPMELTIGIPMLGWLARQSDSGNQLWGQSRTCRA